MKKTVYGVFVVIIVLGIVECMGWLTHLLIFNEGYSKKEIKKDLAHIVNEKEVPAIAKKNKSVDGDLWVGSQVEVLHPYFGYFRDPERNKGITERGFPSYFKRQDLIASPDQITVAVFGGSFAKEFFFLGYEPLKRSLAAIYNKKVNLVNFSIGGYKQPQQLMVLNYLLTTGAHIDVVINVDGFNEVALPSVENVQYGVSPFYPRNWLHRAKSLNHPEVLRLSGIVSLLRDLKFRFALFVKTHKIYRSPTMTLLWKLLDRSLELKIVKTQVELKSRIGNEKKSFMVTGPQYRPVSDDEMYKDLANTWGFCSYSMNALCKAYGIDYFHFLQPNQYDPNSKLLTTKEKKICV